MDRSNFLNGALSLLGGVCLGIGLLIQRRWLAVSLLLVGIILFVVASLRRIDRKMEEGQGRTMVYALLGVEALGLVIFLYDPIFRPAGAENSAVIRGELFTFAFPVILIAGLVRDVFERRGQRKPEIPGMPPSSPERK